MTIQYVTDSKGKKNSVLVSIKDWERIQKKLNTEHFYDGFREAVREVKAHQDGKTKLKNARDLFK